MVLTGSLYKSNTGSNFRNRALNRNRATNNITKKIPTSKIVTENVFYLEDMKDGFLTSIMT